MEVYIIYGVSGCGKTTVGQALSKVLGLPFFDADDYHPKSNIEKMKSGKSLCDEDRLPWLHKLSENIEKWSSSTGAILACSALKEDYRIVLSRNCKSIIWVHLFGNFKFLSKRLDKRSGHFFSKNLLQDQFNTLEIPNYGMHLNSSFSIYTIVQNIIENTKNKVMDKSEFGLIGLGVMGKSLSVNLGREGVKLSVFNRHIEGKEEDVAKDFISKQPNEYHLVGFDDLKEFVQSIASPRNLLLMVNAGPAVDAIIEELLPHLDANDLIIDGGNSHYKDTERRNSYLENKKILYIGTGISGGEEGAKNGPSIMPGGSSEAYARAGKYLEKIAAKDKFKLPCCTYIGKGGAGHFVKMLHNGIEYGEMQIISEIHHFLRYQTNASPEEIADVFAEWSDSKLSSYLLDITIDILRKKEGDEYLLEKVLDAAGQKGTGGWSTQAALEMGLSLNTISEAVMARNLSAQKQTRVEANVLYDFQSKKDLDILMLVSSVKDAYELTRIINHAIGFDALNSASKEYNWELNLSEIARVWTNGCIIKSKFMEDLVDIFKDNPNANLLMHQSIASSVKVLRNNLIIFTNLALSNGAHIPVISSALNYLNGFTSAQSSANLIQAQRDYFGAHTYKRIDRSAKESFHTNWTN